MEAFLTMEIYLMEEYFPVWRRIMMPSLTVLHRCTVWGFIGLILYGIIINAVVGR